MSPVIKPTPIQREIWDQRFSLREALCAQYPLFLHETDAASLPDIAREGLQARNPGTAQEDALIRALGHTSGEMLCLHPLSSLPVGSTKSGPFALLAILPADISKAVTIDWTHANGWKLAEIIRQDDPNLSAEQIFLRVVQGRGSVALLETIAPSRLFVLCGQPTQLRWEPLLPTPRDALVYHDTGSQLDPAKSVTLPTPSPA
jgi:hypothetical protein